MPITIPARDVVEPAVARQLKEVEARLDTLERRVRQLEAAAAEVERVKAPAGSLEFELEDMRE